MRLGVNVDHVATLRQARKARYPDPVTAAALAELAGAGQITIHLREDRRHIQERDLKLLRETVQTLLNLEMAATQEMVKIAYEYKPDLCTLVPERREELTTEGGLDVNGQRDAIGKVVKNLKDGEIIVSLFIDPDLDQVKSSHRVGAERVELHTGRYCEARNEKDRAARALAAGRRGQGGHQAGHGLRRGARAQLRQRAADRAHRGDRRAEHRPRDRRPRGDGRLRPRGARDDRAGGQMKRALTAEQMRAVDQASAEHGMPSSLLMENAGQALADAALALAGPQGRFLVICGMGNNGGDGLVAARKLSGQGRTVNVELMGLGEALEGEPARNYKALKAGGVSVGPIGDDVPVGPGDVVVDALLGTGLSRPPEGKYADAIGRIASWRAAGAKVVAADLPSGLQSDTGVPLPPTVTADVTLSFGFLKLGQVLEPGATLCGDARVIDIGIPRAAHAKLSEPAVWLLEESDVKGRLPVRRPDSHKGSVGHVLVMAGSRGKTGAAALTGQAALPRGGGPRHGGHPARGARRGDGARLRADGGRAAQHRPFGHRRSQRPARGGRGQAGGGAGAGHSAGRRDGQAARRPSSRS